MVARIATSAKLSSVLNYNEQKVAHKDAVLIHSSGFLKDAQRLNFHEKMERFQRLNDLNNRSQVNTLHVSLNFDPSEHPSDDQLSRIADRYMEGLKLQDQPYLVYKHTDAGHPHIHLISTLIQPNGKRVKTDKIGKKLSEPTRKAIEKEFHLVPADSHARKQAYLLQPVDVQKINYGNTSQTKQAMRDVIMMVSSEYKFTSLPEYNAALRQYNVVADPGSKNSRIYKNGGLVYRVTDDQGRKVGVPVKASDYFFKPTLVNLEKKFTDNSEARKPYLIEMKNKIDWVFRQQPGSLQEFAAELQKEGIEVVIRQNNNGPVYGLTYVDNKLKTVANGSDLGKGYSAASVLQGIATGKYPSLSPSQRQQPSQGRNPGQSPGGSHQPPIPNPLTQSTFNLQVPQILSHLMDNDPAFGHSPKSLDEDQRLRRRRRPH